MSPAKWSASLVVYLVLSLSAVAAQPPLPDLRVEPTTGGSIFFVRNTSSQPLTAFIIELVDYPGSSYSLWQDDLLTGPLAAGAEKRIPVSSMTVGAVPDYVKIRAAVYADGTSSGIPEKVAQLIDRRRVALETTRDLIRRLENGPDKTAVTAGLKQWVDSLPPPVGRSNRSFQAVMNQNAARDLITQTAKTLDTRTVAEALGTLRASERLLAASQPPLQ